jgi:hypothetical protein
MLSSRLFQSIPVLAINDMIYFYLRYRRCYLPQIAIADLLTIHLYCIFLSSRSINSFRPTHCFISFHYPFLMKRGVRTRPNPSIVCRDTWCTNPFIFTNQNNLLCTDHFIFSCVTIFSWGSFH